MESEPGELPAETMVFDFQLSFPAVFKGGEEVEAGAAFDLINGGHADGERGVVGWCWGR